MRAGKIRVKPDIVFTRARVAVFVDGCFWHSCPQHGRRPTSNQEYWVAKLDGNVARDRRVDQALLAEGWVVLRLWEHGLGQDAVDLIAATVKDQRDKLVPRASAT